MIRKLALAEKIKNGKYITLICNSHVKLGVFLGIKWLIRKDGSPNLSDRPGLWAWQIIRQKHWGKTVNNLWCSSSKKDHVLVIEDENWKKNKNTKATILEGEKSPHKLIWTHTNIFI